MLSLFRLIPRLGAVPTIRALPHHSSLSVHNALSLSLHGCFHQWVSLFYSNSCGYLPVLPTRWKLSLWKDFALLYVAVFYLLLLTLLAYVLIEMHARSCRVVVCLWRPFHKYYVKVHRNVNPRNSLIDAFTTSLILSYSRLMLASFNLLHPLTLHTPDGSKVKKSAVYYDVSIDTFSHQHLPFVVLSLTVLLFFNLLPAVFLFVYPMKWFQKILGKSRKCARVLHPLADNFQGCYRLGTNGQWDYRWFAGLYMILRGAVFISHITRGPLNCWLVPALLFIVVAQLFANLRPYRNKIFNIVDSLLFALANISLCVRQLSQFQVLRTRHTTRSSRNSS